MVEKPRKLHHDLETRSPVDLLKCGVYAYAMHPQTEVILVSYAFDDGPIKTWYVLLGEPIPTDLEEGFLDPTVILCAHNAAFERLLTLLSLARVQKFVSADVVAAIRVITRWNCTAARSAMMALPRALENVANVLGLNTQKDSDGKKLMMQMCKPRNIDMHGRPVWKDDHASVLRLGAYCEVDVEVERQIDNSIPELSETEFQVWCLTEKINDRGVMVDLKLAAEMAMFVSDAKEDLNRRIYTATNRMVPKVSNHLAVKSWLISQGFPDVEESGVGKEVVATMLESDGLPELVREVLIMRQEGGGTSTSKYNSMILRANKDDRCRGELVFCGASTTKRFCLAEGSLITVLTKNNQITDKPIEEVNLEDKVWDGDEWVQHEGVVFSGEKEVLEHDGIVGTPEHKVYISDETQITLGEARFSSLPLFKGNKQPIV